MREGVAVAVNVGVSVGVRVGLPVGVAVPTRVSVGLPVGTGVGVLVGADVGVLTKVGVGVPVGAGVGVSVGVRVSVGAATVVARLAIVSQPIASAVALTLGLPDSIRTTMIDTTSAMATNKSWKFPRLMPLIIPLSSVPDKPFGAAACGS